MKISIDSNKIQILDQFPPHHNAKPQVKRDFGFFLTLYHRLRCTIHPYPPSNHGNDNEAVQEIIVQRQISLIETCLVSSYLPVDLSYPALPCTHSGPLGPSGALFAAARQIPPRAPAFARLRPNETALLGRCYGVLPTLETKTDSQQQSCMRPLLKN